MNKKNIDSEQWDALTKKQKMTFVKKSEIFCTLTPAREADLSGLEIFVDVENMLNFLGDDFLSLIKCFEGKDVLWEVEIKKGKKSYKNIREKDKIDSLWEACKIKLKKS